MRNVELERSAGPDTATPSLPNEGASVRPEPQWVELLGQAGALGGVQAAARLGRPGTLPEALHLKHAPTLPTSPQLRSGS